MAEKINIQSLVFSITAKVQGLTEVKRQTNALAEEVQAGIASIKSYAQMLSQIISDDVMKSIEAVDAAEFENLKQKLDGLQSEIQATTDAYSTLENAFANEKTTQPFSTEVMSASAVEIESYATIVQESIDIEEDAKKSKGDLAKETVSVADSLANLASSFDGPISKIGPLIKQVDEVRKTFEKAKGSIDGMASGILGIVAIVVQAVGLIVDAVEQAKVERKALVQQASDDFTSISSTLVNVQKAMSVLNDESATMENVRAARNDIVGLLDSAVAGYDNEKNAILVNNKLLEQQIDLLERKRDINNNIVASGIVDSVNEFNAIADQAKSLYPHAKANRTLRDLFNGSFSAKTAFESKEAEMLGYIDEFTNEVIAYANQQLEGELPSSASNYIRSRVTSYITNIASMGDRVSEENLKSIADGYIEKYQEFNDKLPDDFKEAARVASEGMKTAIELITSAAMENTHYTISGETILDDSEVLSAQQAQQLLLENSDFLESVAQNYAGWQSKILSGNATETEIKRYDETINKIIDIRNRLVSFLGNAGLGTDIADSALESILGTSIKMTEQIQHQADETEALVLTIQDASGKVAEIYSSFKNLKGNIADSNELQKVVNSIKDGNENSEDYKKALSYLAEAYNVSEDEAKNYVEVLEMENAVKVAAIELERQETISKIASAKATLEQAKADSTRRVEEKEQLQKYIDALTAVEQKYSAMSLDNLLGEGNAAWKETEDTASNTVQNMLSNMERLKTMDQLTYEEEIAYLNKIARQSSITAEEKEDIEKRLYDLKKSHLQSEYDNLVYYDKLNATQKQSYLKKMIAEYKEGVDARISLEKELYSVQKEQITNLGDTVVDALKNKYQAWLDEENAALDESISGWQTWADEQTAAIQAQIDALNELTEQEDREAQEAEKRRKIAALEQQLLYTNDEYSARKLQEQIDAAKKELQDLLSGWEREDLIADLQKQMDAVQEKADEKIAGLENVKSQNEEQFNALTETSALQAEAEKLLLEGSQAEVLELLKNYAEDYESIGTTFGQRLVSGFMDTVNDVTAWFETFDKQIETYQANVAEAASQAADAFTAAQSVGETSSSTVSTANNITINFNQPVDSPAEIRRELERMLIGMNNL